MSQENVELVYQDFGAWRRRHLDAVLAASHPDVEIAPVMGPASTTYRGHEGMRRFWHDIFSTFPDFSPEVLEARDLGDFVLGTVRIRGQGTGSHVLEAVSRAAPNEPHVRMLGMRGRDEVGVHGGLLGPRAHLTAPE